MFIQPATELNDDIPNLASLVKVLHQQIRIGHKEGLGKMGYKSNVLSIFDIWIPPHLNLVLLITLFSRLSSTLG
jgi:hypothetical protein